MHASPPPPAACPPPLTDVARDLIHATATRLRVDPEKLFDAVIRGADRLLHNLAAGHLPRGAGELVTTVGCHPVDHEPMHAQAVVVVGNATWTLSDELDGFPTVRAVLAAALATAAPAGITSRHFVGDSCTVRGWAVTSPFLTPLSEAEVFDAYCTDSETGEPKPPEHGVTYRAGFPIPFL
ncbi:hypothetical protein ACH4UT_10420 [Streptomyces sp. NPDC020799]|uniref:hypothetical protein n=1 Tax=Streptomyces sp. NPDC020799 TaxID=3365091 RepID=UPI0037972194